LLDSKWVDQPKPQADLVGQDLRAPAANNDNSDQLNRPTSAKQQLMDHALTTEMPVITEAEQDVTSVKAACDTWDGQNSSDYKKHPR